MKMDTIDKVLEFHVSFGIPAPQKVSLNRERVALRMKLHCEELAELAAGLDMPVIALALHNIAERVSPAHFCGEPDIANVLQELTDMQYVNDGTLIEFGLDAYKEAAFAEVHRANMSKLGADGKPVRRADGKVLKGPNFKPADMHAVLPAVSCDA